MTRRLIPTIVLLGLVLGACGGGGSKRAGSISFEKGSEDVILRIEDKGGFVPADARLTQIPLVSIYGDGRYVTLGPQIEIYPTPAMPPFVSRTIKEKGMQAILVAAKEAGLMAGNKRLENNMVADAPTTVFTVKAAGKTHVVEAVALGDGLDAGGGQDQALRKSLVEFRNLVTDLSRWLPEDAVGEEKQYTAEGLRIISQPYVKSDEGPAQQPALWPLGESLAKFGNARPAVEGQGLRCGVVRGEDLKKVLPLALRANQLTPWRSDGKEYLLRFRPLLPDEAGC